MVKYALFLRSSQHFAFALSGKVIWPLFRIKWRNVFGFGHVLRFPLRSSLVMFNSVADAVKWILKHWFSVQMLLHYLDDYLSMANWSRSFAQRELDIIWEVFRYLRIPIGEGKN